jgi:hypothetical protein
VSDRLAKKSHPHELPAKRPATEPSGADAKQFSWAIYHLKGCPRNCWATSSLPTRRAPSSARSRNSTFHRGAKTAARAAAVTGQIPCISKDLAVPERRIRVPVTS